MPIYITETGWKPRHDKPGLRDRAVRGTTANQKLVLRPAVRQPGGYPSWQGSAGGPGMIFYFEAFDEAVEGIDDAGGCGTSTAIALRALRHARGPACKPTSTPRAGYYDPPPFSTVTFDSPSINYALVASGREDSQVVADPVGGTTRWRGSSVRATARVLCRTVVARPAA